MKRIENGESDIVRDLDLPSLIDIVFILLIFFVIIITPAVGIVGEAEDKTIKDLPIFSTDLQAFNKELYTLTFVIDKADDRTAGLSLYVLNPDSIKSFLPTPTTVKRAFEITKTMEGRFSCPADTLTTDLRQLIHRHIDAYRRAHFTVLDDFSSEIAVIADKSTQFGIINAIFEECRPIMDGERVVLPMISKVVFHVASSNQEM